MENEELVQIFMAAILTGIDLRALATLPENDDLTKLMVDTAYNIATLAASKFE